MAEGGEAENLEHAERSQRGNRGILAYKNKFRHQQSRQKLVRWRRMYIIRQMNGESGDGVLNLAEKRCRRQLPRNSPGTVRGEP